MSINSYGQGGSAEKPSTPSSTKQPSKSNKPIKKSAASSKTRRSTTTKSNDSRSVEISYWESIKSSANPDDFKAYLNKYPNGEFADLARNKISSLEAAAKEKAEQERAERERREAEDNRKAEIAYWDSIKNSVNPEDFRAYLRKYPNGEFVDLAKNRIDTLENEAREAAARAQSEATARFQREAAARTQREVAARAQMRGMSREAVYKGFTDNFKTSPDVAYPYAKEYLQRYANDNDQYVDYLRKYVSNYEAINSAKPK